MKLAIASNNEHKLQEIKSILGGCFDELLSIKEEEKPEEIVVEEG